MDGAVDSSSAEQAFIGGIYDGIDFATGDIAFRQGQCCLIDLQSIHSDSSLNPVQPGHLNRYTLPKIRLIIHLTESRGMVVWARSLC